MILGQTLKIGGFVVDRKSIVMNKIYTKSFRNAIGIGAEAFRSDYEGGVILLRGG